MRDAEAEWDAHRGLSHLWLDKQEAFIRGYEAGQRRALEDAADTLKGAKEPDGSQSIAPVEWIEDWLRARASVPTKDGASDHE